MRRIRRLVGGVLGFVAAMEVLWWAAVCCKNKNDQMECNCWMCGWENGDDA